MKYLFALVTWLGCWSAISAQSGPFVVLSDEEMPVAAPGRGVPEGIVIDILNAVTADGGPAFSFDFHLPWTRALLMTEETPTLLAAPVTRTPEREKKFMWIAPLMDNTPILLSVDHSIPISAPDKLKEMNVGVLRGSALESSLQRLGFTRIETASSYKLNVKKLLAGRLDAVAGSDISLRYAAIHAGADMSRLIFGPQIAEPKQRYLAASLQFPEKDARVIADCVDRLRRSGRLNSIIAKYKDGS